MAKLKENMSLNMKIGSEQFLTLYLYRTFCPYPAVWPWLIAENTLESMASLVGRICWLFIFFLPLFKHQLYVEEIVSTTY